VDSGVRAGDEIGTSYDAMIAKVISWAPTRAEAARRLAAALEAAEIHGLRTNRDLLVEVLRHPDFLAGTTTTSFLATEPLRSLSPVDEAPGADVTLAAFAAAVAGAHAGRSASPVLPGVPPGWRNVFSTPDVVTYDHAAGEVSVGWRWTRDGEVLADGPAAGAVVERVERTGDHWTVVVGHDGVSLPHRVHLGDGVADVEGPTGHVALRRRPRFVDPADQVAEGSLLAPMPGSVIAVRAESGQSVSAGDPVLVLEAMKMQHTIVAPHDGVVTDLPVAVGTQVTAGDVLAVVEATETDNAAESAESAEMEQS
jgi:propionyl-CoA carboxylase alpha chain